MDSSPSLYPDEELHRNGQEREEPSQQEKPQEHEEKELFYRTKTIQFLGRTTPIILQNDNGPCPLLAICNVLLLRNNLNLNSDGSEVSQARLLSLVAERLIDSNSNTNNKDAGYLENQQQNIADAIDLLPSLATGIDVNIKFKRIDDFEFTRECAIFDLLDIPLYHGWIVDPQDVETVNAIGCKSYNTLMGELVALETHSPVAHSHEEDSVDFVAATTAALGVPSPSLSNSRSFGDSPTAVAHRNELRKGDLEEEAELLRAMKLSESDKSTTPSNSTLAIANGGSEAACIDIIGSSDKDVLLDSHDIVNKCHGSSGSKDFIQPESSISHDQHASENTETEQACRKIKSHDEEHLRLAMSKTDGATNIDQFLLKETKEGVEMSNSNQLDKAEGETVEIRGPPAIIIPYLEEKISGQDKDKVSDSISLTEPSDSNLVITESFTSIDPNEPLYEGEDIISPRATICEETEPKYEGEAVLAEKADKSALDSSVVRNKDELTPEQGRLIRNFLKNSASQLTFYGLFCLQEGLKERELCVFFRNNHFSTMFKYDGELYLLATDQGFLNQPDLVWEKLNEVNGDTLFMTGNFKEFKVDDNNDGTWNEHNAVTSTAEYIASINNSAEADVNSDLQLAMALQQQEFEQQPSRHNAQTPSAAVGTSGLVVGPQAPRSNARPPASSSSSRLEEKSSKEKCTVM